MTGDTHIGSLIEEYLDGALTARERLALEEHVRSCAPCRRELQIMRDISRLTGSLPKAMEPGHDLWPGIASRIRKTHPLAAIVNVALRRNGPHAGADREARTPWMPLSAGVRWSLGIAAAAVVVVFGWSIVRQPADEIRPSWQVIPVEGNPLIGSRRLEANGHMHTGERLETDGVSRATIEVGSIGQVEVGHNTRIRLVEASATDHRLSLEKGEILATVSSPPRLFFVETPSALAVDLGCSYALRVTEDGTGILNVAAGYVALELRGRRAVVPAGMSCYTRPGTGPGTPFLEDAPETFRKALETYDFNNASEAALNAVLESAREEDAITLWHLLFRVGKDLRPRVYDRLAALLPAPKGATRDGVLRGDQAMISDWQDQVGLGPVVAWEFSP